MKTSLSLDSLTKRYDRNAAVEDVSLEIRPGEFFSILGPSGCGKTTLLRLIAGFESPSKGEISLNGKVITSVPPQDRSVGMVFQNYALFPHMTVEKNVAFGLETRRVARPQIRERVRRMLAAVHLGEKAGSPVSSLSGGEQQRVAVARALVVEPSVLLMDEPLSNLDLALRVTTREEIRSLQRRIGITTVYVTHDQAEAMSLSDRVAVMRAGRIEQVGSPAEVYESPRSPYVAEFLGGANIVEGVLDRGARRVSLGNTEVSLSSDFPGDTDGAIVIAVKPELIQLCSPEEEGCFPATIAHKEYLGFTTDFTLAAGDLRLKISTISMLATSRLSPGMKVGFKVDWSRCSVFPRQDR
ncbi:MAG: ABC transporter ATP-binding protein [Bacteroidota bacterium]